MARGHKVRAKQNLLALFSCTLEVIRKKLYMVLKLFKLSILILL